MDFAKFLAAMFDFDGTITKKGVYNPSKEMADALVKLAQKMPIAFCTGRQLESFVERGLGVLLDEIDPDLRRPFLKNLYLIAENGSVGYHFNIETDGFEKFYQVDWPEKYIEKVYLQRILEEAIKDYGSIYYNAHKVVIVMRTKLHDYEGRDVEEVYALSEKIYQITKELLLKFDQNYEDFLHVGNSGIGVIVCPAEGDKDRGVKEFAKVLREKHELKIGEDAEEILVIGDSPQSGGNDFYFLQGKIGIPFNVGENEVVGPERVFDQDGRQLFHDQGTLELIKKLL